MKKIIVAVMCVVMSLVMFGCGQSNEEKYTTLKNEVRAEINKVNDAYPKIDSPFYREEHYKKYKVWVGIGETSIKNITPKLEEMKKLSQKELKLANDFTEVEKQIKKLNKNIQYEKQRAVGWKEWEEQHGKK